MADGRDGAKPGVLLCLSYDLPNVSGLTLLVREEARVLAEAGHPVTIATSRPKGLPAESRDGPIRVLRSWTPFRIGKAPFMPFYALTLLRGMRGVKLVGVALPNADAAMVALLARLTGRKVIVDYISSLSTAGTGARVARAVAAIPHLVAGLCAQRIRTVSADYAAQSTFCRLFRRKLVFAAYAVPEVYLQPPAPQPAKDPAAPLRVAYVGRLARQKSLGLLLEAFHLLPPLLDRPVVLDLIGPAQDIVGETDWKDILARASASGGTVRHLGSFPPEELRAIYPQLDLLVLPSTDRQESFGLVQVEAMAAGVPCVAMDLPGMAEPIRQTGMGLLVDPPTPQALARAMAHVLMNGPPRRVGLDELHRLFGPQVTCAPFLEMASG